MPLVPFPLSKRCTVICTIALLAIGVACGIVNAVVDHHRWITAGFGIAAAVCSFVTGVIALWGGQQSRSLDGEPGRELELVARTNVTKQPTLQPQAVVPIPTAALSIMKEVAGTVPVAGLDRVPELALEIAKMIEGAPTNQRAFQRLAKESSDLACFIVDVCRKEHEPEEEVSVLLESHIVNATRTLKEIRDFTQLTVLHESSDQPEVAETDREMIDDYLEKLEDSQRQFRECTERDLLLDSKQSEEGSPNDAESDGVEFPAPSASKAEPSVVFERASEVSIRGATFINIGRDQYNTIAGDQFIHNRSYFTVHSGPQPPRENTIYEEV